MGNHGDFGTHAGGTTEPQADLAAMLAEMDGRLQALQQELESIAVPITRRADAPPVAQASIPRAPRGGAAVSEAPPHDEKAPPEPAVQPRRRATRRIAPTGRVLPSPEAPPNVPAQAPPPQSPEAVVRRMILDAEDEARRVVQDARSRIAEIGARTRTQLEHSLATAPSAPPAAPPRSRGRRETNRNAPERREYAGAVTVEAGPFADVVQLGEFEDALAAVPEVEDVYIRTFERYYALFELQLAAPTALIAELQARTSDTLRVIEATATDVRLEIARDALGGPAS